MSHTPFSAYFSCHLSYILHMHLQCGRSCYLFCSYRAPRTMESEPMTTLCRCYCKADKELTAISSKSCFQAAHSWKWEQNSGKGWAPAVHIDSSPGCGSSAALSISEDLFCSMFAFASSVQWEEASSVAENHSSQPVLPSVLSERVKACRPAVTFLMRRSQRE